MPEDAKSVDSFSYSPPSLLRHLFFSLRCGSREIETPQAARLNSLFCQIDSRSRVRSRVRTLGYRVCVCVLFRDRVDVSRDFIVAPCVIVCSMLEDKRCDFLSFFFFNFVKNLMVEFSTMNDPLRNAHRKNFRVTKNFHFLRILEIFSREKK